MSDQNHLFHVPGYELLELLARGGMANVYKARQQSLGRVVAVKIVRPTGHRDLETIERFRHEARIAATVNHHNIVTVYDAGEHAGLAYSVMELVPGESLGERLVREGVFSEDLCLRIVEGVASGMNHAWERVRLVHCDIKPDNILIDAADQVKIADLGVARLIGTESERLDDGMIVGTPNYSSPEQLAGQVALDARSDIYALGSTLYQLLTGKLPFAELTDIEALDKENRSLPDPALERPQLGHGILCLLEKMMARDRNGRPADWAELLGLVHKLRHGKLPSGLVLPAGASTVSRSPGRAEGLHALAAHQPIKIPGAKKPPARITVPHRAPLPVGAPRSSGAMRQAVYTFLFLLFAAAVLYVFAFVYLPSTRSPSPAPAPAPQPAPAPAVRSAPPPVQDRAAPYRERIARARELASQADGDYQSYLRTRANPALLGQAERRVSEALRLLDEVPADLPEATTPRARAKALLSSIHKAMFELPPIEQTRTEPPKPAPKPKPAPAPSEDHDDLVGDFAQFVENLVTEPAAPPAPPPKEEQPAAPAPPRQLALSSVWDRPVIGGRKYVLDDLRHVLRDVSPKVDLQARPGLVLADGAGYLDPVAEVARRMNLRLVARSQITTPCFPDNSLFYYRVPGRYPDGFTVLNFIVDMKDQLVALQYEIEPPPAAPRLPRERFTRDFSVYDFMRARTESGQRSAVAYDVQLDAHRLVLDSEVLNLRNELRGSVRLVMPRPLAELLRHRLDSAR